MWFLPFYGVICDNLEFSSVKSSKIFPAQRIQRDTKFKHEKSGVCKGSFFILPIYVFSRCEKNWSSRFPLKTSSD